MERDVLEDLPCFAVGHLAASVGAWEEVGVEVERKALRREVEAGVALC